jgi:concentrative nucleoside transporter, CNT family
MNMIVILQGLGGLVVLLGISFLFSNNKRKINWRLVGIGVLIQMIFAILILKGTELGDFFMPLGWFKLILEWLGGAIVALLGFTTEGTKFVFGKLGINAEPIGVVFAFQVLPTIIFVSAITSLLYYLGILQKIVQGMAWVMIRLLGTSGAESLSNTANIFVGQTEAPLLIKPYIEKMTKSEILTIMIGGMATIAGGVMAAYIQILGDALSKAQNIDLFTAQIRIAVQLLAASTMAAPASLVVAKMLYPETEESMTKGTVKLKVEKNASNVIEAVANGAADGVTLVINVAGMLVAFIALIALFNYLLVVLGDVTGLNAILIQNFKQPLSLQLLFGLVLQVLAIAIGVPWQDALSFGSLIGTKVVLNEFVAYLDMSKMIATNGLVTQKAMIMASYALCGFANFSSIAIQIGGIGPLAPSRKKDIAALGMKAVLGGTLATLMTATIGGMLLTN